MELTVSQFFNLISESSDVLVSNLHMEAHTDDQNFFKNTDGWDIFRSDNVVIQDSYINNGDDCVAFKSNSTNIVVQGLQCNGSHGISVGSLGEERLDYDIAENIYIYNISLANGTDPTGAAVRIKVYPDVDPSNPSYTSGGGGGYVKNVTYDTFYINNDDWAIEVNQCYSAANTSICNEYPVRPRVSSCAHRAATATDRKSPEIDQLIIV